MTDRMKFSDLIFTKNTKNTKHNFPFLFFCQSFMGEDGKARCSAVRERESNLEDCGH